MKLSSSIHCILLFACHATAFGCLWDRDTLRVESRGKPDLLEIITGRFERNPPEFFEHRLTRVSRELETSPERLDLYDDAAVACDRLNRSDEALAWLEKKRAALEQIPDTTDSLDHRYRYHANLGTVMAHRWIRAGATVESISEMTAARNEIAKAIELNPNAHFGREKYQLMAMDWILKIYADGFDYDPSNQSQAPQDPRTFVDFGLLSDLYQYKESKLPPALEDSVEGISGLVYLGDAWQSVDVFYALQTVLQGNGDNSIAMLAQLRRFELEKAGSKSLFPTRFRSMKESHFRDVNAVATPNLVSEYFHKARAEADLWHRERTLYMKDKISGGSHPDTDVDFWEDFTYRTKAPKPEPGWSDLSVNSQIIIALGVIAAVLFGVPFLIVSIFRWARLARRAT